MSLIQYVKQMQLNTTFLQDDPLVNRGKLIIITEIANKVKDKLVDSDEIRIVTPQIAKRIVIETAMSLIERVLEDEYKNHVFDSTDKANIYEILIQNMFGYGAIEPYLKDQDVTEIMINGYNNIYYEKNGKIDRAMGKNGEPLAFSSNEDLRSVVQKIVAPINRKVDESDPIVDARLPDGSRVNIALSPISLDGISVTIRKFPEKPYTMDELVSFGTLPENVAKLLQKMILAGYNIIVSGGTGSGKTTFLNALSTHIPATDRVITIEDSAELKFDQVKNKIRLETRPPNIEGKGEISMRTLVRSALRMRPDRIIVGEVRGGEALDMLQAMNTGHDGSLSTGHANSAMDMVLRLETMIMMAGLNLTLSAIRQQIVSALDIIVHLGKLHGGLRKVLTVSEIIGLDQGEYRLQHIFEYKEGIISKEKAKLCFTGAGIHNTLKFQMAGISDYSEFLL